MASIISLTAEPVNGTTSVARDQLDLASSMLRFDELDAISRNLSGATNAKHAQERALAETEKRTVATSLQLKENRENQPRTARRLERNAHPRFFHYMQINREQKVKQLEKDLEALKVEEKRLEVLHRDYEVQLQNNRTCLENAKRDEARAANARAEKQSIVDQVAGTSRIPNHISSIGTELLDCEAQVLSDANIVADLDRTMAQVNQARQLFECAHQELLRASRDNRAATFEAEAEMFSGEYGNDYYEVRMQRRRDHMINAARKNAFEAGNMLQAAFDRFPMEARVRFPELTRNICNAAIPNMMGADAGQTMADDWFGGSYGAFRNDRMAQGKIDQNLAVLLQCEQLAARQAAALLSVITQVRAQHAALEQRCLSLKASIEAEKMRVFQMERQSIPYQSARCIPQQSAPYQAAVF